MGRAAKEKEKFPVSGDLCSDSGEMLAAGIMKNFGINNCLVIFWLVFEVIV